jgi:hypothetical protein
MKKNFGHFGHPKLCVFFQSCKKKYKFFFLQDFCRASTSIKTTLNRPLQKIGHFGHSELPYPASF